MLNTSTHDEEHGCKVRTTRFAVPAPPSAAQAVTAPCGTAPWVGGHIFVHTCPNDMILDAKHIYSRRGTRLQSANHEICSAGTAISSPSCDCTARYGTMGRWSYLCAHLSK